MIKRVVCLAFQEGKGEEFLDIFNRKKEKIRAVEGCYHMHLTQSVDQPDTFMTISYWHSVEDLDAYRSSDVFRSTWPDVKAMFAAPPQAWSLEVIDAPAEPPPYIYRSLD